MTGCYKDTVLLLVNTGTPLSSEETEVRAYLREFLSDRRIVDLPRWKWLPLLHGIILRRRPRKTAERYRELEALSQNNFMETSLIQAALLEEELQRRGYDWTVISAMRYGKRRKLRGLIQELVRNKVKRVVILPLFAQYASVTSGSIFDELASSLRGSKYIPSIQFISEFFEHPAYIAALARAVEEGFRASSAQKKDRLLIVSYHSSLLVDKEQGDPYQEQLSATTQLLAQQLKLRLGTMEELSERRIDAVLAYQSVFDKRAWLLPLVSEVLDKALEAGYRSISVVAPIFVTDCLETLGDIDRDLRRYSNLKDPTVEFNYIPALNTRADFIAALAQLIETSSLPT